MPTSCLLAKGNVQKRRDRLHLVQIFLLKVDTVQIITVAEAWITVKSPVLHRMSEIHHQILETTGASAIRQMQHVQTLWSGYGEIERYFLEKGKYPSVIVKHIRLPDSSNHPKGWNTPLSHQRKLTSYQVERQWYHQYASHTNDQCRVPRCYHTIEEGNVLLLIMEDLDRSGYPRRLHHDEVTLDDAKRCLSWLACFHGQFIGAKGEGLWPIGTYWHLDTRPEELEKMNNLPLKHAAKRIDERLSHAKYQTLVHGDAKLANFCFGDSSDKVAAVDFQYVGKGCGIKDVAYFISSCFHEEECESYEGELLDHYFNQLDVALNNSVDFSLLKKEWSTLYRYAWADFYRFLDGWSPGHWKMHTYSERIAKWVIDELN